MLLSSRDIKRLLDESRLGLFPYRKESLQPASYDLTLDEELLLEAENWEWTSRLTPYVLRPGEFVLASTIERVELPDDIAAQVRGRSGLARQGLIVEIAGFVDPGFRGTLTLELTNVSRHRAVALNFGMGIAQISFEQLSSPALVPYGHPLLRSHYQNQRGPTPHDAAGDSEIARRIEKWSRRG